LGRRRKKGVKRVACILRFRKSFLFRERPGGKVERASYAHSYFLRGDKRQNEHGGDCSKVTGPVSFGNHGGEAKWETDLPHSGGKPALIYGEKESFTESQQRGNAGGNSTAVLQTEAGQ